MTTLVHINQYNTYKQSLEKKIGHVDKTTHDLSVLVIAAVLNTKIGEDENKILGGSGLVKKKVITLKYQTLRKNILLLLIIINL